MNPDPLDDLLKAYSEQPLPPPLQSKAMIWREIEQRRHRYEWFGIFPVRTWGELFAQPRLAIAGLAIALVTGIVPAAAAHSFGETPRFVRDSLHLDVFTTCATCVPANFLADHRRR